MNNSSLFYLESLKQKNLQKYDLDEKSVNEFRKKIKKISDKNKNIKGKELYELVINKNYDDDKDLSKIVELVLDGADILYSDEEKGNFPLLICSRKGYLKTFIVLIKAGANVNQSNNYLTTCTMAAARHNRKEILEILILLGADINAKCLDGDSAIMSAKKHGNVNCFNMLVEAQAILNAKNLDNKSLLDIGYRADFDYIDKVISFKTTVKQEITEEDAFQLLDEATQKLKKINGDYVNLSNKSHGEKVLTKIK